MSKFDAAIISLRDYAMSYRAAIISGALESVAAAIRVLEAAGKVDKVGEMATFEVMRMECEPLLTQEVADSANRIRALLEALPDGEVMP